MQLAGQTQPVTTMTRSSSFDTHLQWKMCWQGRRRIIRRGPSVVNSSWQMAQRGVFKVIASTKMERPPTFAVAAQDLPHVVCLPPCAVVR